MNNIFSSPQLSQSSLLYKPMAAESTAWPSVYSSDPLVLAPPLHWSCSCFGHLLINKSLLSPYLPFDNPALLTAPLLLGFLEYYSWSTSSSPTILLSFPYVGSSSSMYILNDSHLQFCLRVYALFLNGLAHKYEISYHCHLYRTSKSRSSPNIWVSNPYIH